MSERAPRPLLSIGLPVYNGADHLKATLAALRGQDYPRLEIVVSDNASTDGTEEICRRLAAGDPRLRYARNVENIGPLPNFFRVLERATGEYFMWAAHDDLWNPHYATALAEALDAQPEAVLATPKVVYTRPDGTPAPLADDAPAPGTSRHDNLRTFFAEDAAAWFYGVYRTDWLRAHAHEMREYPVWGGDVLWLTSVLLRYAVVGSPEAVLTKEVRRNATAPKTEAEQVRFVLEMLRQLTRICRRDARDPAERTLATRMAWRYTYGQHFRRRTPLKTFRRLCRVPWGVFRLWRELRRRPAAPLTVVSPPSEPCLQEPGHIGDRRGSQGDAA